MTYIHHTSKGLVYACLAFLLFSCNNNSVKTTRAEEGLGDLEEELEENPGSKKSDTNGVKPKSSSNPAASKFVILEPSDSLAGTVATITVQAQDASGQKISTYEKDVTLLCSGSASSCGLVTISSGEGSLNIQNTVAETVHLTLIDTLATGLDVSSAVDVLFEPAPAAKFVILDPDPGLVNTAQSIEVEVQDQYGNKVNTYNLDVTLDCSGSASNCGLIDIVSGSGSLLINNTVAETVNLSLSNPSGGLDASSTKNIVFAPLIDLVDHDNDANYGFGAGIITNQCMVDADHVTLKPYAVGSDRELRMTDEIFDTSNLISYWTFNGTAGNGIANASTLLEKSASGNSLTAIDSDADLKYVATPFGVGVAFTDNNDELRLAHGNQATSMDVGTDNFTFSLWFKKTQNASPGTYRSIAGKYGGSTGYLLELFGNNVVNFYAESPGQFVEVQTVPTISNVDLNTWYLLTGVRDGSVFKIYLNGVLHSTAIQASVGNISNTDDFVVAFDGNDGGNDFLGEIDEILLIKRALSSEEIRTLYLRGVANYPEGAVFTSRIIDTGVSAALDTLNLSPYAPYGKNLPGTGDDEIEYSIFNADANLRNGLVSLWHMDDGILGSSPVSLTDSIGNNPGTVSNGGSGATLEASHLGKGMKFDGSNDYVDFGNDPSLNITGSYSISAWVKRNQINSNAYEVIFSKWLDLGGATYIGYDFFIFGDESFGTSYSSTGAWAETYSQLKLSSDVWYHLVVTHTDGEQKLYANGAEVAPAFGGSHSGNAGSTLANSAFAGGAVGDNFNGSIDELAIWNRALTLAEVQALYARGAVDMKFKVRACAQANCLDGTFIGSDGTANSYFTFERNDFTGLPIFDLTSLSGRYFQYKVYMQTLDPSTSTVLPRLNAVELKLP